MKKNRKPTNGEAEWKALLDAPVGGLRPDFHPCVGYLYEDGSVVRYNVTEAWTPHLHRAVASCFGSCARRMRGTWDAAYNKRGEPIAALLMVTDSTNKIVWRQRVDFPK
jgi:hypothetical protein